jgi:hypothetical protein
MSLGLKIGAAFLLFVAPTLAHAVEDSRNFVVGHYEEVFVEGDIQVEITNNSGPSAKAMGDAKLVDALSFVQADKVVRIKLAQPLRASGNAGQGTVKIKLTGRNIRKLTMRGTGKISIDAIKTVLGQFDVRGPGAIYVGKLQAEKVQVLLQGSGLMKIESGATNSGSIYSNGTANLDAPAFDFGKLVLLQTGAATTTTKASASVTITNSGPGLINIGGTGSCMIRQAGTGTITCPTKGGVK